MTTASTRNHASTGWRSDGSPSSLGGSSHGWVPVNTHSTPVPGTPGMLWVAHSPRTLHRHQMSPRHPSSFNMVAEQVSVQGESAQPACCLWRLCDERNKSTFETYTAKPTRISPVHHLRYVDDCRMHTCGPRGTCVDGVNSYICDHDPGFQGR